MPFELHQRVDLYALRIQLGGASQIGQADDEDRGHHFAAGLADQALYNL